MFAGCYGFGWRPRRDGSSGGSGWRGSGGLRAGRPPFDRPGRHIGAAGSGCKRPKWPAEDRAAYCARRARNYCWQARAWPRARCNRRGDRSER